MAEYYTPKELLKPEDKKPIEEEKEEITNEMEEDTINYNTLDEETKINYHVGKILEILELLQEPDTIDNAVFNINKALILNAYTPENYDRLIGKYEILKTGLIKNFFEEEITNLEN